MPIMTTKQKIGKVILTLIVWIIGLAMVFPFVWMISSAFKTQATVYNFPIEIIPKEPTLKPFKLLFLRVPYWTYFFNSVKVAILAVTGTFFSCTMAGFAYAKIPFKGRNGLFLLKLTCTMIPGLVTMVPTYMIWSKLGLVNTHAVLWLPYFLGGTFGVFMMRQAFMSLPTALMESARIDGANNFQIYWKIALPNVKATVASLLFFYFLGTWNDYTTPLLYLRDKALYTLPLAVKYFNDKETQNVPVIMAANLLMLLPVMVFFFSCQKFFVNALVSSGVKG